MKVDITYLKQGLFTEFIPQSKAGEDAWRELAKQTEGTGKVLTVHFPAVLAQLRKAGYTVKQAKRKRPEVILLEMAGIMAALERMDA
jgi:hypothetical protein